MKIAHTDIETCIIALLDQRAPQLSICPSEVARALAPEESAWRALMPAVRQAAAAMAQAQRIDVTQGPHTIVLDEHTRGPIRLRRGARYQGGDGRS